MIVISEEFCSCRRQTDKILKIFSPSHEVKLCDRSPFPSSCSPFSSSEYSFLRRRLRSPQMAVWESISIESDWSGKLQEERTLIAISFTASACLMLIRMTKNSYSLLWFPQPNTEIPYQLVPQSLFTCLPIGAEELFFSLQDEEGNPFYHTTLKVSPHGETIALPPEAPELAMGKNYLWYVAPLEPGSLLRPDNYAVVGWVTRVESTTNEQTSAASPVELATAYAKVGLWYDTLKVLADARASQPDNQTFATEWQDLLKQVELDAIAAQPLGSAIGDR
jgi:Domain of Unknown Function (DUF928)